jgi:hypothetical protein
VVQRQVLYLGEINDNQRELWRKSIEVFEHGRSGPRTVVLFAEDQTAPVDHEQVIQVRLKDLKVDNRAVARRIRSKNGKHGKFSKDTRRVPDQAFSSSDDRDDQRPIRTSPCFWARSTMLSAKNTTSVQTLLVFSDLRHYPFG